MRTAPGNFVLALKLAGCTSSRDRHESPARIIDQRQARWLVPSFRDRAAIGSNKEPFWEILSTHMSWGGCSCPVRGRIIYASQGLIEEIEKEARGGAMTCCSNSRNQSSARL